MQLAEPFRALRPATHDAAARVIAPPYDVVTTLEARTLAAGNPDHFLHVSRAEIDLPDGTDPHADAVYAQAARSFARLRANGTLIRDPRPGFYVYRLAGPDRHVQTGVACAASIKAYRANRVRRHEQTRPDKETDRVRHIEALAAQTGPVLCAYRDNPTLTTLVAAAAQTEPLFAATDRSGVTHTLWRVDAAEPVAALSAALDAVETLYIADGHHRAAAAARVAATRDSGTSPTGADFCLTVAFPAEELRILDYNRVVTDLNGLDAAQFLERLDAVCKRRAVAVAGHGYRPSERQRFGMYLDAQWFELELRERAAAEDPVASLDVSLLHDRIIEPILGVSDARRDPRIDYVGGSRGLEALVARVDSGVARVAFALYPTPIEALMAVADTGRLMPPKSTWFEPKLADGLIAHLLD